MTAEDGAGGGGDGDGEENGKNDKSEKESGGGKEMEELAEVRKQRINDGVGWRRWWRRR